MSGKTLRPIVMKQVSRKSSLMTDTAGGYMAIGKEFARHEMVDHGANQYVRGDASTNTVERLFALLKRGIVGTYHNISEATLKRYLAEFDFRYNTRTALGVNNSERTTRAIKGAEGKHFTYQRINETANAQVEGANAPKMAQRDESTRAEALALEHCHANHATRR